MAISSAQIDLWRTARSEHQRLEFKEAKRQYDFDDLCRYCVALANEGGGHFVLGVANQPPRAVVGTQAVNDVVAMAGKLFRSLGFRVDVEEVQHPDGRVVVLTIPSRPKGTAYNWKGTYLMRAGEELVPMSEDVLRGIFAEGEPDWLEEPGREELHAQDVIELLDTPAYFQLLSLPYPSSQAAVLERLGNERLLDQRNGRYSIRRIGAILLARDLNQFPDLARKAARVVVYATDGKLQTRLDHTSLRGYAAGFQELVLFINSQLPQNEVIRKALRTEVKMVPEIAVRELVANALIHQDFRVTGASTMVEVYPNRVEISNPGNPIVPVDRFIDGYQSRNERLADLMRRMRICEERSSGIDQVITAVEAYQLPAPFFSSSYNRTQAILFGPRKFEEMDRADRVRACYQHCCLLYVMSKRMTNQSLRERFHLASRKTSVVSQIIAATVEAGLTRADISAGESRKLARYLPFWA